MSGGAVFGIIMLIFFVLLLIGGGVYYAVYIKEGEDPIFGVFDDEE